MANTNSPMGLVPYARTSGEPYNGATATYYVPASNATALYIGDPVVLITNSSDGNGIQAVGIATAGSSNAFLGSFQGISNNAGLNPITLLQSQTPYLAAGQAAYVEICIDPDTLYEVQESGAIVSGAPGRNINLLSGTGSTVTGISGWQIDSSSLQATTVATGQMRIIRLLQETGNAVGTNAKWLCRINLNQLTQAAGT